MRRMNWLRRCVLAVGLMAGAAAGTANAQGPGCPNGDCGGAVGTTGYGSYGSPDLFYNFYTQGYANGANAAMYLAPVPVPPHVGHTYITYQPFYPHEYMYWHHDRTHRYYDDGRGLDRTHVKYYGPPVRTVVGTAWKKIQLPR